MAEQRPNAFTSWELSQVEEEQGSIFTTDQIHVLRNRLSVLAEDKLRIQFDPQNPQEYMQQEAYKRGQLEEIESLLFTSEAAEQMILERIEAANPSQSQPDL